MTSSTLMERDLSHLSDKQRALLAQRLKGREVAVDPSRGYAPTALIRQPQAWFEPFELRGFQQERLSYLRDEEDDFVFFMETRRTHLDMDKFRASWQRLHKHYDVMRSRILHGRHVVLPPDSPYDIVTEDLRGLPAQDRLARAEAQRERILKLRRDERQQAVEVAVCQVEDEEFHCFFSFDLMVMDLPSIEFLALRCRRVYDDRFDEEHRPYFSIRDYRLTEDAYLASLDGEGARRYWDRKTSRISRRLRSSDLLASAPRALCAQGPGYRCQTLPQAEWANLRRIAASRGLSEFAVVQTLFMDLLARQSGQEDFGIETRVFQRLPFDPHIYELLGPFTIGQIAHREKPKDDSASFSIRCKATQEQGERDAVHGFFDAATHWQAAEADSSRGQKLVFTNTCIRFEELARNSVVPPVRWLGDVKEVLQTLPDTAIEYVLVENDHALENHWLVNHANVPPDLVDQLYARHMEALRALCAQPSLWDELCVLSAVAAQHPGDLA